MFPAGSPGRETGITYSDRFWHDGWFAGTGSTDRGGHGGLVLDVGDSIKPTDITERAVAGLSLIHI